MIYSTDFEQICSKIKSIEVVKYLKDLSWAQLKYADDSVNIFIKNIDKQRYQVRVPMEETLFDYNRAMLRVAEVIAESEQKSVEEIVLELLNPVADIIEVRIDNPDIIDGSILFEDAIKLYENTKKLITAAALDFKKPEKYHRGKLPDFLQNYIDKCRFGQTKIGSYVTNVVCPFIKEREAGELQQLTLFDHEDLLASSLTRNITNKLISSLDKVKMAIKNGQDLEELTEKKQDNWHDDPNDIISINFLDALSNLNLYKEQAVLEFNIKWAPTIKLNKYKNSSIKFTEQYFMPLNAVVETYKSEINKKESKSFYIGRISDANANPDIDIRDKGIIQIVTLGEKNKKKTIKAELNMDDFRLANIAFLNGHWVSVRGEQVDDKKNYLKNCVLTVNENDY